MSLPEHWPAIEIKSPSSEGDGIVVSPPTEPPRHVVTSPKHSKPVEAIISAFNRVSDKLHKRKDEPLSPRNEPLSPRNEPLLPRNEPLSPRNEPTIHLESSPPVHLESSPVHVESSPVHLDVQVHDFKVRHIVRVHVNCGVNWSAPGQEIRTRIGVCKSDELVSQLAKIIDRLEENQIVLEKINAWLNADSDSGNLEIGALFDGVKDQHNCTITLIRVVV